MQCTLLEYTNYSSSHKKLQAIFRPISHIISPVRQSSLNQNIRQVSDFMLSCRLTLE